MDFITDVTKLLRHYSPQTDGSFLPEGKLKKLFDLAISKPTTDRQAVQHLYGPEAQPQEKKFLMLKKDLEDRLTNQLLQQGGQTSAPPTGKETWDRLPGIKLWCRRQMILAEMLLTHHLHHHTEKILLKVSKQAENLLFYHILEESWLLLRQVYLLKGEAKKIALYDEKVTALTQQKQRINQASGCYERLQVQANSTIARSERLAQQAQHSAALIARWLAEKHDPFLELYSYRIRTIAYTNHPDTRALQTLIQEESAFIKKHKRFRNRIYLVEIYLNRIYLCQAKGNLPSARRYAERLLTFQHLPWNLSIALREKAFIVYMRRGEYDRAGEVLRQTTQTSQTSRPSPFQTSQWYLREAYLHYALVRTHREADASRLAPRFSNKISMPEFDRQTLPLVSDKQGYQVQVLIMKTLLLLQQGKKDWEHHAKSLKMYYQRHLTDLEDTKTKLFFRMVIQAAVVHFDSHKIHQQTHALVQELEALPRHFQEKQELIPYPVLWEMIGKQEKVVTGAN